MHFTYIVRCSDGSLYTGYTTDIEQRVRTHNAGKGAKYTRSRRPVKLVYLEESETKQQAMQREAAIKKLKRQQKEQLIEDYEKNNKGKGKAYGSDSRNHMQDKPW